MTPQGTGGRGKQDYGTPHDFIQAVRARFGGIDWDLAATQDNAKAIDYITPEQDSLKATWPICNFPHLITGPVRLWLNPPFANIEPWARKCAEWAANPLVQPGSRLYFLVPAAVGTNWWNDHVSGKARVLALRPRLTFDGCTDPFPKDCVLCVYEPCWPEQPRIVEPWRWTVPWVQEAA